LYFESVRISFFHLFPVSQLPEIQESQPDPPGLHGYLKSNPVKYSKCNDSRLEKEGYPKAIIKNYILVYKVDESNKTVVVLRFFYGAREFAKLCNY